MKRLVFCFDGTWDKLDAPSPTNVVLLAQSVSPIAKDGKTQIIHYDQGVGTTEASKWTGGLLGAGLLANIVRAYTFLIFNYEIGDEIFVFGFSRGAFTARSFAGLLRTVGILRRADAGRITEAVELYQNRTASTDHDSEDFLRFRLKASPQVCVDRVEDAWRCHNQPGYVSGTNPVLRIRYIGVWDTVGSLGVPDSMFIAPFVNRKLLFHDTGLSDFVVSARHAVSIDERRTSFLPTLWTNFEALNASLGFGPDEEAAPYQQKWFPGNHGSVGGGGPERGLSDIPLEWVVDAARAAGLQLDTDAGSRIFSLSPNPLAPLSNYTEKKPTLLGSLMKLMPTVDRLPGPNRLPEVSSSAIRRWSQAAETLPERQLYRPKTLARVAAQLDRAVADSGKTASHEAATANLPTKAEPTPGSHYKVVRGDTLTKIAHIAYKDAAKSSLIQHANPDTRDDPNHIYIGQILYLPADA